jgi:hypothetical protein
VLYSMPAADLLTLIASAAVIARTYKQLGGAQPAERPPQTDQPLGE